MPHLREIAKLSEADELLYEQRHAASSEERRIARELVWEQDTRPDAWLDLPEGTCAS